MHTYAYQIYNLPTYQIFNGTRDDNKDYGQLYTDPFFFNKTWIKQQEAEYEKMAKQRVSTPISVLGPESIGNLNINFN